MKILAVFLCLLTVSCASTPRAGSSPKPINVYRAVATLPAELRRVAVLPVTIDVGDATMQEGRGSLESVLRGELNKTGAFEVIPVSHEQLRAVTGHGEWSAEDSLPADFFARLQQAFGCDAVMFCKLTEFRAYPPLAVGWGLTLVDTRTQAIVWAVDEVFDAGKPCVASEACDYYSRDLSTPPPLADPSSILLSPRWFGQYAASTVLDTLPGH